MVLVLLVVLCLSLLTSTIGSTTDPTYTSQSNQLGPDQLGSPDAVVININHSKPGINDDIDVTGKVVSPATVDENRPGYLKPSL